MTPLPTIEELNQHLRNHRAAQYCNQFRSAINVFFYVGDRKKKPNKSVEYLTELIWLFMHHAVQGTGFAPEEMRRIKRVRKNIEAAIAASPTQDSMTKACSEHIASQKKSQLIEHATFRAGHAIMFLDDIHEPWTFSELMSAIVVGGNQLRFFRDRSLMNSQAFFFDIADILRQEGNDRAQEQAPPAP